jgi:hypothetical protein
MIEPKTVAECDEKIRQYKDATATWVWVSLSALAIWLGLPAWAVLVLAAFATFGSISISQDLKMRRIMLAQREERAGGEIIDVPFRAAR